MKERDFETQPYTPEEERVAKYISELSNGNVGGGDDPIGFLIASHGELSRFPVQACTCFIPAGCRNVNCPFHGDKL